MLEQEEKSKIKTMIISLTLLTFTMFIGLALYILTSPILPVHITCGSGDGRVDYYGHTTPFDKLLGKKTVHEYFISKSAVIDSISNPVGQQWGKFDDACILW